MLANDTDPDGEIDRDSVTSVTLPGKGTLLLDTDGNVVIDDGVFTYTQDQTIDFNENGISTDQFDYNVADTEGGARNGRVFITIIQIENLPPLAVNDTPTVVANGEIIINVIDNDSDVNGDETIDASSVTIDQQPAGGTAVPQGDGTVLYTNVDNTITQDTFSYTVADEDGAVSNVATVTVAITTDENPVNLSLIHI